MGPWRAGIWLLGAGKIWPVVVVIMVDLVPFYEYPVTLSGIWL
jgi:hypothetical protein